MSRWIVSPTTRGALARDGSMQTNVNVFFAFYSQPAQNVRLITVSGHSKICELQVELQACRRFPSWFESVERTGIESGGDSSSPKV